MIKKVVLTEDRQYYLKDTSKDFNTEFGMISKKDLKKNGRVLTNKGKEMFVFDAGFVDRFRKLKRGAQIITLKDAGCIISETGINNRCKVVEAGGGSGALTCVLGNICKEVVSYELKKNFFKIVKENVMNLGLSNVKVKNKDITKGISEKKVDLIVLDMLEADKVIDHAAKSLKAGGFLVAYLPSITQIVNFVKKISKNENFVLVKVVENIQREWKIEGKIARPEFRMLGHTGFLTFVRKI